MGCVGERVQDGVSMTGSRRERLATIRKLLPSGPMISPARSATIGTGPARKVRSTSSRAARCGERSGSSGMSPPR